jgi:uncharacterized protein (TIGR02118 family)
MYAWRDNPALTAEQCEQHYRTVHMELARRTYTGVPGFRALRYSRVRRHLVNDYNQPVAVETPTDMDAFVELYFDDAETLQAAFTRPELAAMFADHENFMAVDIPANVRVYELDETTILEA